MPIELFIQFRAKPGGSEALLSLLLELPCTSRRAEGGLNWCVRQNPEDPDDIVLQQT